MFSASKSKGASGSYQIANSLRFRSSASAYLNRTPASSTNQNTWTWSGWSKRGVLGANQRLFSCNTGSAGYYFYFGFNSSDNLVIYSSWGSVTVNYVTTQVFRDPSSWYHIVLAADFTQSIGSNGVKLYINGSQVTAFSTSTYSSSAGAVNGAYPHNIGRQADTSSNYFDGYLADINFIDGQALTPSSFGQISTVTGVWQPKAYSGTYGTNGFKLNFSNGTSTTTLGYDSSGNGNNWTTNNISLTAGSTYDWMIDSPTPFAGSSYGVGNYCVWNPLRPNAAMTYANGNLSATSNGGSGRSAYGTLAMRTGKWYFETTGGDNSIGVSTISETVYALYLASGSYNINGSTISGKSTYTTSDTIGVAYDADSNTIEFFKNNTSQGSTSFSAGSGQDVVAQFNGTASVTRTCVANFGQRPFSYTPPSGYKSLCTFNLPTPTIQNGANYMAATTYTGTGATQSITNTVNNVSFQPDFVWIKCRNAGSTNHEEVDSVRGAGNTLYPNLTNAESATNYTTLNSNGFSLVSTSAANVNANGNTYVAWQWKANGTAVSNTAGSITSQVSANTTAGFSVVTFTAPSSAGNFSVGHGLGVAPSMVITKRRDSASQWWVWHIGLGDNTTSYLSLNSTNAVATAAGMWGSVGRTSALLGYSDTSITTNSTQVAYCFAAIPGYSAFGSYTGNGSADGPFIYTGFRPRFVLIKWSSGVEYWQITDSSRSPNNQVSLQLAPDQSLDESSLGATQIDYLSNGFKLRGSSNRNNASGGTYIYAAFCESPFTNALAR